MTTPSSRRVLLFGVLAVTLSLVFSILLAEAVCRFGRPSSMHFYYWEAAKPDLARRRIFILGDSFTYEQGATSIAELRRELEKDGRQVLNLGWPGVGPSEYFRRLSLYGSRFKPDVVFVNYYVGNDLTDTMRDLPVAGSLPQLHWYDRSFLYQVVLKFQKQIAGSRAKRPPMEAPPGVEKPVNPHLLETARLHGDYLTNSLLLESDRAKEAWQRNKIILRDMKELTESWGGRFVLAIVPRCEQINRENFAYFSSLGLEMRENFLASQEPQRLMLDFCREQKIACLDMLPEYRRRPERDYCIDRDDHWNAEGNRVALAQYRKFFDEVLSTSGENP